MIPSVEAPSYRIAKPLIELIIEDFPLPLFPVNNTHSPLFILKEMSFNTLGEFP